ncbi:MAG: hypothetical protein SFV22_02390 [Saprospiraceae bacterium]|nr:hypothetical protein [Saprospiraceae bacterium]
MIFLSHLRYATSVWLTGLFAFPILFMGGMCLSSGGHYLDCLTSGRFFLLEILQGMTLFSIPGWLVFLRAVFVINRKDWGKWEKKSALFGIALLLILLTLFITRRSDNDVYFMSFVYWSPGLLAVFLYKLPHHKG